MPKISLAGFKDPVRRPRYIIWTGVAVLALAAFMITALGVTSTYWFCANGCHKVQDDTIIAYDASSHSEISCMACHMPVNANPVVFILHKAEALGEAYLTIANKWEFPLNHGSHLSMSDHMPAGQCTQCHNLENRDVTPSDGIIIDHAAHSDADVACSWCHNRVAHPEDFQDEDGHLTLTHPATGEPNVAHDDFMEMTACFRCHGLEDDANAPGECSKCHPSDFELKPPSHFEGEFYPHGHAEMALEDLGMAHEEDAHVEEASHEEAASEETTHEEGVESEDEAHAEEDADHAEEDAHGDEGDHGDGHETYDGPIPNDEGSYEGLGVYLPAVSDISYCGTCHLTEEFCMNCHGMDMPHPEEFKTETHPEVVNTQYEKCILCHDSENTTFCDDCHHGDKVAWEFDAAEPWFTQHAKSVVAGGIDSCLEACHDTQFCSDCHTAENPYPSSHKAGDWLHRATYDDRAQHSEAASDDACGICHGEGGVEAKFCADCHQFEMPHEDEFKERHAATGLKNEAQCAFCHKFGPVCSTCHHFGIQADFKKAHPATIVEQGTDACFELCHDKAFCVDCHTTENAVPTSHSPGDFTRKFGEEKARHVVAFEDSAESCTYCHGDGGTEAKFCTNCHGMEMPHASSFYDDNGGGDHAENLASGSLKRASCENCHKPVMCNSCHHEQSSADREWYTYHDEIVLEEGAEGCLDACHEPTYCANCHVGLSRQ